MNVSYALIGQKCGEVCTQYLSYTGAHVSRRLSVESGKRYHSIGSMIHVLAEVDEDVFEAAYLKFSSEGPTVENTT